MALPSFLSDFGVFFFSRLLFFFFELYFVPIVAVATFRCLTSSVKTAFSPCNRPSALRFFFIHFTKNDSSGISPPRRDSRPGKGEAREIRAGAHAGG